MGKGIIVWFEKISVVYGWRESIRGLSRYWVNVRYSYGCLGSEGSIFRVGWIGCESKVGV